MSQTGRRLAILIGSSKFDKEPLKDKPLKCPERDVDGMHELLAAEEFGAFGEVFVFKNSHHQDALDQIEEVLTSAARDDQVLIYYSGHGETDLPGRLYLTATNTDTKKLVSTSIPIDTLRTMIENSACRKIILILDCCFGGAAGKSFVKGSVDEKLKELARGYGIYILTASTAAQTAQEREGDDYGLLTKHIITGIKEGAAANDDGLINMDGLYRYVYAQVTGEGYQEPMHWALNVKGEDLIIARASTLYSAQQLLDFKRLINRLDEEEEIAGEICAEVRLVIEQKQPKRDKRLFELLAQLHKGVLKPGKFVSLWSKEARITDQSAPTQFLVPPLGGQVSEIEQTKPAKARATDRPSESRRPMLMPEERSRTGTEDKQKTKQQNPLQQSAPRPSEIEMRAHDDARRFARLLLSEIKLYNAAIVNQGRNNFDIYDRLKYEIDRSRMAYDKRVSPSVLARIDYFYDELVQCLAEGDPKKLGVNCPGPTYSRES